MKQNRMRLPDSYHIMASTLFGLEQCTHLESTVTPAVWKRELTRTLRCIRRAVNLNLQSTTDAHRSEVLSYLTLAARGVKHAETTDEAGAAVIQALTFLILCILGRAPNHFNMKSTASDSCWSLAAFRSITYAVSDTQRYAFLIDRATPDQRQAIFAARRTHDLHTMPEVFTWVHANYPDLCRSVT